MISLTIEEQDGDIHFRMNDINRATNAEKEVILSILQSMNNDFEIDEAEITMEQENGSWS